MATALNDLFQLKLHTTSSNSPITALNVFWFRLTDFGSLGVGADMAEQLNLGFNTEILSSLNDVTSVQTVYPLIESVNYANPIDFDECTGDCSLPSNGARAGDSLPFHTCWSFRYRRPGPGFRSGYKRFAGPSEDDVGSLGNATAAAIVLLDALASALAAEVDTPVGGKFFPVVATGVKVLGTNPSFNIVPDVDYAGIGSQVSRKKPLF